MFAGNRSSFASSARGSTDMQRAFQDGLPGFIRHLRFSGRADRRDLLVVSLVITAFELVLFVLPMPELMRQASGAILIVVALAAIARRLHDIGLSGWWQVLGIAASLGWTVLVVLAVLFLFGLDALVPGSMGYPLALGATFLAPLGLLLWVHLAPGDPLPNRFGPPRPVRVHGEIGKVEAA
jgi:uncharacterized membrane protein YhaH (DUF805 family)